MQMLREPVSILFVHAFPLDSRMWRHQMRALRDRHNVFAPDLRGFGQNRKQPLLVSVDKHATDLVAQMDQRGMARAVVVGLSMGGYVAMAMQRLFPHRVAGLLLASTRSQADSEEAKAARNDMIERVSKQGVGVLPAQMLSKLVTAQCSDTVRDFVRKMMVEQTTQGVVAALEALRDRPDATGGLEQVHCPSTVLVGANDELSPLEVMAPMAEAMVNSELRVIPNAGHLSNLEQPGEFSQAVRDLYERVKREG